MANYTVAVGEFGVYGKILAAGVADTVTFGVDLDVCEIYNPGDDLIYVCFGAGKTATVAGQGMRECPPHSASQFPVKTSGPTVVKVISSAASTYSCSNASG
jgi:hypothetical protein